MSKMYDETQNRLKFGIECTRHLIRQKLLFNIKDNVGIILKGTKPVSNSEKSDHIAVVRPLNVPSLKLFEDLNDLVPNEGDQQGDIFESINIAIEEFIKEYGKKKVNKRIFLMTDGESNIRSRPDFINIVAKKLYENDIKLNLIAVDFFDEEENEENKKVETRNQQNTKAAIKILMAKTENVKIFTTKEANEITKQFRKKKINPVSKFRGPLMITPDLSLEVAVYSKTAKIDLPSLKKHSLATDLNLEDLKSGQIINERVYYINDDPDQTPLANEFITKAYNYGSSLVPISKTDEVMFKNQENKCLKVIGFTDAYKVPRHNFMGGTDLVIPNPESDKDIKAFAALVNEMKELNKVVICRYVYRENADPKLIVLSPHIGSNGAVLYLNALPTVEDIRDYQFESLKECTIKQEEVMSKFIDSLDLEKEIEGEEDGEEALKPGETFNPVLQYFYQCLEHKALKKENNLPDLDETIEDYLRPDKKLFEGNKYVTFLPKVFEIKEKELKEDKKKRVFWREMINSEIQENTGVSDRRLEEKLEAHKEEAKKNISATKPIEDFKEMLNYKYQDLTVDAMNQMKDIIFKFIIESFKGSYYIKAMECIKTLRDSCIDEDEIVIFNEFLNKLKSDFPKEKFLDFWVLIVENRISLINVKENKKSTVSEQESKDWLDDMSKKEVITSVINDMDELMADLD